MPQDDKHYYLAPVMVGIVTAGVPADESCYDQALTTMMHHQVAALSHRSTWQEWGVMKV